MPENDMKKKNLWWAYKKMTGHAYSIGLMGTSKTYLTIPASGRFSMASMGTAGYATNGFTL